MSADFHCLQIIRSVRLSMTADELRSRFSELKTRDDLAMLLDCSLQQLTFWCHVAHPNTRYKVFEIKKANGSPRTIEAPSPVLRVLQQKLLQVLEAAFTARAPAHGFVKGKSILTNASQHASRAWVLNLDLSDFFHAIHFGRVRGIFQAKPFSLPEEVAVAIAQLTCANGRLPQGAPTSPMVSNIVAAKMDGELRRLAKESGAIYTRYADDLTFSVRRRGFPQSIAIVGERAPGTYVATLSETLQKTIEGNGFRVNDSKLRIQPWKRSQRVTGLVVNEKPNVPRRLIRRLRGMLHAWETHGLDLAQTEFIAKYSGQLKSKKASPSLKARIRGTIEYVGQIRGRDDAIYLRLLAKYRRLAGEPEVVLPKTMNSNEARRDVFICHASEDKRLVVEPLVQALDAAGVSVWFDKAQIRWGDSITGKINEGLASSRFLIVVVSSALLSKRWPLKELNAALMKEIASGTTTVLPLMVGTDDELAELQSKLPLQSDKLHLRWSDGASAIVSALKELLAGAN